MQGDNQKAQLSHVTDEINFSLLASIIIWSLDSYLTFKMILPFPLTDNLC